MIRELLAKNWWVFVLRGILAILFGVGAFAMPGITLAALIMLYAAYAVVDGIVAAVAAFTQRKPGEPFPWSVFLIGLVSLAAGIGAFAYPGLTALALLYLIAGWYVVRGVSEILVALRLRKEIEGEGWLIAGGVLSVLFGLFLFAGLHCVEPAAEFQNPSGRAQPMNPTLDLGVDVHAVPLKGQH